MTEESTSALRLECDRLTAALAEKTAQLDAISKEFEQFSQAISHDLRAPLRAVEGFAQILAEDYGDKLDEDGKRCIETLSAGAHKASALIEALRVFSRLCRAPFSPATLDMKKLVAQKVEEFQAEGATAKFKVEPLPEAWGDAHLVEAIFEHLLSNAVKFSQRQPRPAIEVSGRKDTDGTLYSVRDNGVGFDPKYSGRLFAVFQRLHDEKDFPGHGIGLATVQRAVHRHGGKVWAEAKLNGGATFFFTLPTPPQR